MYEQYLKTHKCGEQVQNFISRRVLEVGEGNRDKWTFHKTVDGKFQCDSCPVIRAGLKGMTRHLIAHECKPKFPFINHLCHVDHVMEIQY